MLVPSAADVLQSCEETLDKVIRPALRGTTEQSAAATMSHMLRHAKLRIEREGQLLTDDIAALEAMLPRIRDYCRASAAEAAHEAVDAINAALAKSALPVGRYPSLEILSVAVNHLRQALGVAIDVLRELRKTDGHDPAYLALREAIRKYLAEQITAEDDLIKPAFDNRGPRR